MSPQRLRPVAALQGGRRLPEALEFMQLLWSLAHVLESTSKRMESTIGVTGPQRLVVRLVGRLPGLSAGELAQILHLHPSTLTGVLQRLERRRLIERRSDPVDRRRALLVLTPEGRRIDSRSAGTVEANVRQALAKLEPGRVRVARTVLGAVIRQLEGELAQARTRSSRSA